MTNVTKADLNDTRNMLLEEMRRGFDGVYARQDKTNGRVLDLEDRSSRYDERIKTLFRRHVHARKGDVFDDLVPENRSVTRRDVAMFVCGGCALWAAIKGLAWIAPALLKMVAP